jgi:hypothetical protein
MKFPPLTDEEKKAIVTESGCFHANHYECEDGP